ncbi:MAG: phosphoribosyl-ATP diphosphatase [Halobacteriales archaeon]
MTDPAYLAELMAVIERRRDAPSPDSYVSGLLAEGAVGPRSKVREEADEVLEASEAGDPAAVVHESADLLFHLLVLLAAHDLHLDDVVTELEGRRRHATE